MPVDVSMYAAQPNNNPLTEMSAMGGIMAQANQNKLFPLVQQRAQIENQREQTALSSDKLNFAHQGFQIMSQQLGSLAQDPRLATPEGHDLLVKTGQNLVQQGLLTPDQFANEIKMMPTDPAQLPQYVQTLNVRSQDAANQFTQIYGAPGMVNNGQQQLPVATSSITGQRQIGAPIQNQQSPGELNAPTQIGIDAQGRPIMGTQKQFQQKATGGDQAAGDQADPNSTNLVAGAGPNGQAAAAPPPSGQQPAGGGIVMGLAPGVAEAQNVDAQASAQQGVGLQQRADTVPANKAQLQQMLTDQTKFTSGPLTDQINHLKAMGNQLGITNFDTGGVAGVEGFRKLANQIALQQTTAMGAGTDQKLTTAMGANPNESLSNLGIQQISHLLLGNEDAIAAKNQAWQQYKGQNGPQSYSQFSTQFNKTFDPRVFQANYMSQKERADLVENMKPADKAAFVQSLRTAAQNGWLKPGQPAGSANAGQ